MVTIKTNYEEFYYNDVIDYIADDVYICSRGNNLRVLCHVKILHSFVFEL